MKKILLAIDDTKGSLRVVEVLVNLMGDCVSGGCIPGNIILLYVKPLEGRSV